MTEKNEKVINNIVSPTKLSGFNTVEEMKVWADTIIESGLLPDSISEPEQVIVIVQHGRELGLTPHVALNNIHIIAGRPVVSSSMLGALLKRAGVEWKITKDFVAEEEDRVTSYVFYWKSKITDGVMEAEHSITWKQMTLAGYTSKHNWNKYPKEMMRARCLSSGVRALFPEILMGFHSDLEINDVAEDLGGDEYKVELNESGEVIIEPIEIDNK